MSGTKSRDKGKRGEREVATIFREVYPDSKRAGWKQVEDDQPDVAAGDWWIECKLRKSCNAIQALEQAARSCPPSKTPLACCRSDGKPWTATLYLEDLIELLANLKRHEEAQSPYTTESYE